MNYGYYGNEVGNILNELLENVIDENIDNNREKLLEYIEMKKYLESKNTINNL